MTDTPLRIVMCTQSPLHHYSFTPQIGPGAISQYCFAEEFKKRGFTVLHLIIHTKPADESVFTAALEREKKELGDASYSTLRCEVQSYTIARKRAFSPMLPAHVPAEIERAIAEFRPDVIYGFDVWGMGMLENVTIAPKLLLLGDIEFQVRWYHLLYGIREKWSDTRRFPMELLRCLHSRRYYKRVLSGVTSNFAIAQSSEPVFARMGLTVRYMPYAWPEIGAVSDMSTPLNAPKPTFLFYGTFGTLGSRSALHMLLKQIYPRLRMLWGQRGFTILFCGLRTLPPWVAQMIAGMPEIEFLGFVDDLSAVMHRCHAVLAPIDVPVGNRVRILTAMSLGDLVIAHANAALGNPTLIDGQTCYLAKDADAFVERMRRSVEHPEEALAIRRQAREAWRKDYSPEGAGTILSAELLRTALKP